MRSRCLILARLPNSVYLVRPATPADAEAILAVLHEVVAEGIYTAISKPWSVNEQERYIAGLSERETIYVAETDQVIGYQVLELWAATLDSMAHVGQVGTFVTGAWRGKGVGVALFRHTLDFAHAHGYGKFVIQVRSRNVSGQAFYRRLGFRLCGSFSRQVRIGEEEDDDDEVLMEYFL